MSGWPGAQAAAAEPPPLFDDEVAADEFVPPDEPPLLAPATAARPDPLDDGAACALIGRIVVRDERALGALYDATCARVHGLVLRITRRAALAEEVVEDTYWQVWRQAPRFDAERGRAMAWLLAIARSRAIDALRRDERFRHAELPEEDQLADDGAPSAGGPHDLLEAARNTQRVREVIETLDARSRQLVSLAFFRGLTHEEIAEQAALPLGTVKSLIRRALQQMKKLLEAGVEPCRTGPAR